MRKFSGKFGTYVTIQGDRFVSQSFDYAGVSGVLFVGSAVWPAGSLVWISGGKVLEGAKVLLVFRVAAGCVFVVLTLSLSSVDHERE